MMAFCPEHPKWDQNPEFTPLSETTSIPTPFIRGVPPPRVLSSCFKMASDRGGEGVTMFTSTYRVLKVWIQNHFVPVPRHWFPGSKCGQSLRLTFRANVNLYNMTECSLYWSFANHHVYTKKVVSFITFILDSLSSHFFLIWEIVNVNLSFVMNAILNLSLSLFRIVLNLRPCQGKFRQATWLKK